MALFFTLPPSSISYPYVLMNAINPQNGLSYLLSHRCGIKAVIIDSGIEIFRDPRVKEYPGGAEAWINRLVRLYDRVRNIVGKGVEVYVTCCDYPDDYNHKALWISEDYTNIERTVENVLKCVDWYGDVNWLIPVQGWNRRPSTLLWSLEYLEQLGVLGRYRYLAVANLCVELNTRIVRHGVMYVHSWLRSRGYSDFRLHVFGLKIAALSYVDRYIHSFDSTAWTRPVSKRLHEAFPWSAKNEDERVLFFCEYMLHLLRYNVLIPGEVFEQCLEKVKRMERTLVYRYPRRCSEVHRVILDIKNDLAKVLSS